MHQEFDHHLSMNDTVMSMTRRGVSLPGLVALGVCTIGLLTLGSAVSSALLRSRGPCSSLEARPAAVEPQSADEVFPVADVGPDVRICEATTMEGD